MFYIDIVLSDEQRAALVSKDVSFSEMTLGTEAYHRCGIAFSEEDCGAVLDVLGLIRNVEGYDDTLETPKGEYMEEYSVLSLLEMPTPTNPIVWINRHERGPYDDEAFSETQPDLGLGLVIGHFRRDVTDYRHRPGVLFVNIFSSPQESFEAVEDNLGGRGRSHYRLLPDNLGKNYIPINCPEGKPMAYFRGDANGGSLWVLFRTDLFERSLLDYILHAVTRLVHPELGAVLSYDEYEGVASRERFIGLAGRRLKEESNQIDERVNSSAGQIETARQALVQALRQTEADKHRREELQNGNTGEMLRRMKERLAKEFDELSSSPDFESLELREDRVVVVTRPLKLRHEGRVYEIGKFQIRLPREGYIKIQSVDGQGHPHVRGGDPCFGNSSEGVAKLQAEMSFGLLLPFLVNYLENGYNPADSYSKIEDYQVKNYSESEEQKKPAKAKAKPKAKAKGKRKGKSKATKAKGAKSKSSKTRPKSAKRSKAKGAKK